MNYTLDDCKSAWQLGMLNGATVYEIIKDNAPQDKWNDNFSLVMSELAKAVTTVESLKELGNNQMLLVSAVCEVLGIEELK